MNRNEIRFRPEQSWHCLYSLQVQRRAINQTNASARIGKIIVFIVMRKWNLAEFYKKENVNPKKIRLFIPNSLVKFCVYVLTNHNKYV